MAQSVTVLVIGPMVSKLDSIDHVPVQGTNPKVGFRPTIPHQLAGARMEPP